MEACSKPDDYKSPCRAAQAFQERLVMRSEKPLAIEKQLRRPGGFQAMQKRWAADAQWFARHPGRRYLLRRPCPWDRYGGHTAVAVAKIGPHGRGYEFRLPVKLAPGDRIAASNSDRWIVENLRALSPEAEFETLHEAAESLRQDWLYDAIKDFLELACSLTVH
jgi:hypothetical protein